ncbi:MAG: DUF5103 domain-containing protein [Bacteroidales bacterium]|nr:DUF5103 domain-containing protein [Bacteroidales bacterium]
MKAAPTHSHHRIIWMKQRCLAVLLAICLLLPAAAQDLQHIALTNMIYVDGIHSVQLYKAGNPLAFPAITLNSSEKLTLAFDDLAGDGRYLKYTFIHCTHDWKPDGMNQIEYLDGFMEDEITEYSYSFNTLTNYTHYTLDFPNEMMRIQRSGNYILHVYDDSQDHPVLTRRFVVVEPMSARIDVSVHRASDVSEMYTKQEVDFVANTGAWSVRNPSQFLHATILQNGRWDNAITGLRCRFNTLSEYSFDYDDNTNVFNGGSEFRFFDLKSLKYNGSRIVSSGLERGDNHAYVVEDQSRPFGPYVSGTTSYGRCYYKTEDFEGENREEYVHTHFTLRSDYPIEGGKVYVFGELTDWRLLPEAQLQFTPALDAWETTLLIKQGYYNYQYVFVPDNKKVIDETYIEGSHWETQNEYVILLYLLDEGGAYDRLIGYINTSRN